LPDGWGFVAVSVSNTRLVFEGADRLFSEVGKPDLDGWKTQTLPEKSQAAVCRLAMHA